MDIERLIEEKMKETKENFKREIEEEMKQYNIEGYNLLKEYKESLLNYWKDGHGEKVVLISELQGFVDCLIRQNMIEKEKYSILIDYFREELDKES